MFPTDVGGFVAGAAGFGFTLLSAADGSLWAAGRNTYGQLGAPATLGHLGAFRVNAPAGFRPVAGRNHTMLLGDHTMWAAGCGTDGALSTGLPRNAEAFMPVSVPATVTDPRFVAVAAGEGFTVILAADGAVHVAGKALNRQLFGVDRTPATMVPTGFRARRVAAGGRHSLLVDTDGQLWACGNASAGQCGCAVDMVTGIDPVRCDGIDDCVVEIAAGESHSVAVDASGRVLVAGSNAAGQLGCVVGDPHRRQFVAVPALTASRVWAGGNMTVVEDVNGELWFAGGHGSFDAHAGFVRWSTLSADLVGVRDVAVGEDHVVVIDATGHLWVAGRNQFGQFGWTGHGTGRLFRTPDADRVDLFEALAPTIADPHEVLATATLITAPVSA